MSTINRYWNYFLALEDDLEKCSRFIEFDQSNYEVFSIELAHLLLASSSEIDVIAKLLCAHFDDTASSKNINDYQKVLSNNIPDMNNIVVYISRHNLSFKPWNDWTQNNNPSWWRSYNNVKHFRSTHFHEATLINVLNSMSALLIMNFELCKYTYNPTNPSPLSDRETTNKLKRESKLLKFESSQYYHALIVG